MKEAAGELNMTVVIVVAIGILVAFLYTILWPSIRGNFEKNSQCSKAICRCPNNMKSCQEADCYVKGNESEIFKCAWKG